jgi:hypothetical protein
MSKARHEALFGTAREVRRAVPAQPPSGRAWHEPVLCRAGLARWNIYSPNYKITHLGP